MKYQLQLSQLRITGFRGFINTVDLSFDKRLTVLIGDNGSGKSTVLDAVAIGLMYLRNEITGGHLFEFPVPLDAVKKKNYDVNNNRNDFENALDFCFTDYKINEDGQAVFLADTLTTTAGFIMRATNNTTTNVEEFCSDKEAEQIATFTKHLYNTKLQQQLTNVPILVYYGCNSINTDTAKATIDGTARVTDLDLFDTYRQSLEAKTFNFEQLLLLLDRRQKSMLQDRRFDDRFLDALQIAISGMLNDNEGATYANLRINYGLLFDEVVIDKTIGDKTEMLYLNQMSSGEKVLLGLVADLTRRLYLANTEGDLLHGNGIVLIDEIDLHLHPKWQRKVLTKLLEIFPDVQFVVTTHSPVILGGIASKYVKSLHNGVIYSVEDTYGRDVEDILETIMQVDAGKYTQKIKKIAALIAMNELQDAENAIMEMHTEIDQKGDNGADHPDILRMNSLLTRKKIIGR